MPTNASQRTGGRPSEEESRRSVESAELGPEEAEELARLEAQMRALGVVELLDDDSTSRSVESSETPSRLRADEQSFNNARRKLSLDENAAAAWAKKMPVVAESSEAPASIPATVAPAMAPAQSMAPTGAMAPAPVGNVEGTADAAKVAAYTAAARGRAAEARTVAAEDSLAAAMAGRQAAENRAQYAEEDARAKSKALAQLQASGKLAQMTAEAAEAEAERRINELTTRATAAESKLADAIAEVAAARAAAAGLEDPGAKKRLEAAMAQAEARSAHADQRVAATEAKAAAAIEDANARAAARVQEALANAKTSAGASFAGVIKELEDKVAAAVEREMAWRSQAETLEKRVADFEEAARAKWLADARAEAADKRAIEAEAEAEARINQAEEEVARAFEAVATAKQRAELEARARSESAATRALEAQTAAAWANQSHQEALNAAAAEAAANARAEAAEQWAFDVSSAAVARVETAERRASAAEAADASRRELHNRVTDTNQRMLLTEQVRNTSAIREQWEASVARQRLERLDRYSVGEAGQAASPGAPGDDAGATGDVLSELVRRTQEQLRWLDELADPALMHHTDLAQPRRASPQYSARDSSLLSSLSALPLCLGADRNKVPRTAGGSPFAAPLYGGQLLSEGSPGKAPQPTSNRGGKKRAPKGRSTPENVSWSASPRKVSAGGKPRRF